MREIFYEETVLNSKYDSQKVPYLIFRVLACFAIILSIFWIIIGIFVIDFNAEGVFFNLLLAIIPAIIIFIAGFFCLRVSDCFCVEYDYVLVNEKLSFSKVIHNSRRINLSEINIKKIENIGLYDSQNFHRHKNIPDVKIEYLTPNDLPQGENKFIYILINVGLQKKLFILETDKNLIKNMKVYLNSYAIDEELF